MGDEFFSSTSKIDEYARKFGGFGRFFDKVLGSLEFPFGIINVERLEVEISNLSGFRQGMKCYELYYGRREKCEKCLIDQVVKSGKKVRAEKNGEDIFLFPIFGQGGKVVSVINYKIKRREVIKEVQVEKEVVKEVVKERVVEKMNREHEESFYNILQNSQDLVYRYNFEKKAFEYISEAVYTLTGFPLGEFVKMSYEDFLARVHPEDLGGVCEIDGVSGEAVCEGAYRWRCKDEGYRWFLDRRTWFFDEEGERICVVGDMKDISEDKAREADKLELEERIAFMKRKELELNERVDLTDKEKVVLWGFCLWPLLNDDELASKLELKRSTLTAIKNRLKGKDWFSLKYIPNFSKLGCQFFGVFDGVLGGGRMKKLDLEILKKTPEVILCNYHEDKFFGVFVSDKYVEFRKFLEKFENENKEMLRLGFNENSFFYDLEDFELRDFSEIVNSLFELGRKEKAVVYDFKGRPEELNVNEKRVLHAMIRDPDMSSADIAKKVWVSKPTVIKIRNKLIDEGFVYAMVIPDFKKLGLGFFGRLCYEFDSDLPVDVKKKGDISRTVLRVNGKRKVTKFILFSSEEEYVGEVDLIKESYRRSGVYFKLDCEIFEMQKRGKKNFDLEPFVNELLFGNEG
ncbi:PAS domain-containing protein [Candidatus Pacearchaeota archaeon]|nr:PAS domain-containing protein [Candidatus Pacearchaeota archaeon]